MYFNIILNSLSNLGKWNLNFGIYNRLLTYSQEEVEDEFVEAGKELDKYPTPLEFLFNNAYHYKDYEAHAKAAF